MKNEKQLKSIKNLFSTTYQMAQQMQQGLQPIQVWMF